MTAPFGARLRHALDTRGPLCVGIDPHCALLRAWDLGDDVAGLDRFAGTVVEALADRVAVLKPQSAFFERFGSRGVAVLERTVADARAAGALVVLDAKRGDVGSTVEAYAQAYLDPAAPLFADALTASPYLGFDSLEPLYASALRHGAGVFVLGFTSNPEGASVQRAVTSDGTTVGADILGRAAARNAAELAGNPAAAGPGGPIAAAQNPNGQGPAMGSIGVVLGATIADLPFDLRWLAGPVLAPGFGAQGGTAADLARIFAAAPRLVLPSTSREVLAQGPSVAALRSAATSAVADCRAALSY
ncbi:MAG TPA: orotidine-5'-phosphate decarboxylase [Actinocrinis sp.]|nr:orotidine-5'-phosphate decarboxylase [Actinocrinis sp.]